MELIQVLKRELNQELRKEICQELRQETHVLKITKLKLLSIYYKI